MFLRLPWSVFTVTDSRKSKKMLTCFPLFLDVKRHVQVDRILLRVSFFFHDTCSLFFFLLRLFSFVVSQCEDESI